MAEATQGPSTALTVVQRQQVQLNEIRQQITSRMEEIATAFPEHLRGKPQIVERWKRVIISAIAKNPDLIDCAPGSILSAVQTAAQLGLEPTGVLGSAYLVPFKGKATLIAGYRGLIDLARRSNQIESIEAHVVHAADRFTCRFGLNPALEHEPAWTGEPGPVIAAYAVAMLKGGAKQVEVMTRAQLDKIKNGTQSGGKKGPWLDHEEEMQRKTVVRRICKYLPLTADMADAFALEHDEEERPAEEDRPKGVAGLKKMAAAQQIDVQPMTDGYDPETGEVHEAPAQPAAPEPATDYMTKLLRISETIDRTDRTLPQLKKAQAELEEMAVALSDNAAVAATLVRAKERIARFGQAKAAATSTVEK